MSRPRLRAEDGSALTVGWVGLTVAAVALVLVVDLTAYLVAAGRAQAAADAAALAAALAADPRSGSPAPRPPEAEVARVARAWDAEVRRCACRRGTRPVEVVVAVEVRAVAVTRFAGRTVTGAATARLVRDRRPVGGTAAGAHGRSPPASGAEPDGRSVR